MSEELDLARHWVAKAANALLMPYAVEIRYPDEWFEPSADDAREARQAAERVLDWLRAGLPAMFE